MPPDPLTPSTIKQARLAAGLTQPQLAAALIDATPEELERFRDFQQAMNQVRRWEQGANQPDRRNTPKLRRILNID